MGAGLRAGFALTTWLACGWLAACAPLRVTEAGLLENREQAVIYSLAAAGAQDVEELTAGTGYAGEQVGRALAELEREGTVVRAGTRWEIDPGLQGDAAGFVESVRRFDLDDLRRRAPGHRLELSFIDGGDIHIASAVAERPAVTLVIFGGNGFRLVPDLAESLKLLAPGRNLFLMDYPGVGGSAGEASIGSIERSADRFYRYVLAQDAVRGRPVVIYGFSLGGFVAARLAARYRPQALILDSTAPDIQSWVDASVPWYARLLVEVEVDDALRTVSNTESLAAVHCPVLVIAGSADRVTPPSLAEALYAQAAHAPARELLLLEGAGHGQSSDRPEFAAAIGAFIRRASGLGKPGVGSAAR